MRKIAPIGKKNFAGKKFRSAKPNELNASDKNVIRNNINELTKQQLAFRIGKPIAAVEKFIKKEKLTSTLEVQEGKANVLIEKQSTIYDGIGSSVESKKEIKKSKAILKKTDFIQENYQKYSANEMAKELGVSINVVRYHLKKLNLTPSKVVKTPTEAILKRNEFIKENHKKYTVHELSAKLHCSRDIVRHALRKLKLTALRATKSQKIPASVINFIRVNYRLMTASEMSNALDNVSWRQVKYLCEKYGFLKTPEETAAIRHRWNRSEFTESEEKYIIANHGNITLAEIANNIDKTRSSVAKLLARKGLKITKEQHGVLMKKNYEKAQMKLQEKKK
jgi:predicted transcriptional regulator